MVVEAIAVCEAEGRLSSYENRKKSPIAMKRRCNDKWIVYLRVGLGIGSGNGILTYLGSICYTKLMK